MEPALAQLEERYSGVKLAILDALAALRSDEFDHYFDSFTEDAVWMMPAKNHDVGIEEARKFYGFTKNFRFDQEVVIEELLVENDIAVVRLSLTGIYDRRKTQLQRRFDQLVVMFGSCACAPMASGELVEIFGIIPKMLDLNHFRVSDA